LRKQYGTTDDDELILRALVPGPAIEKMRAAGPVKTFYPLLSSPELDQVRRLMKVATSPLVQLRTANMNVTLRKHGG
jgi:oxaloacetate decarboxylase alpha subunit